MPKHKIGMDDIKRDITRFLDAVDEVMMFGPNDGEPLAFNRLDEIIEILQQSNKVRGININTNATIIPNEKILKALAYSKVIVRISDYGIKDNINRLVEQFNRYNIHYEVLENLKWFETGQMQYQNKDEQEVRKSFLRCSSSIYCKRIHRGNLYKCIRSYCAEDLKVGDMSCDKEDLSGSIEERRRKIRKIYLSDTADACRYCKFGDAVQVETKKAEQV